MAIDTLPASLQGAIQENLLYTAFQQSLRSILMYRTVAQRVPFPIAAGESITATRAGLKAAVPTPLNPQTNTNLDNGVTPSSYSIEQYTMRLNMYGDTQDLNLLTSQVAIASVALQNAVVNGEQAARTMDTIARDNLYAAYLGGNTFVTATLGAPGTQVQVNDIRGFANVLNAAGQVVPVDSSNPLPVIVNGTEYSLIGVTQDVTNTSTARNITSGTYAGYGAGGLSGTLTFSSNVSIANATAGNAVIAGFAPAILRPNGRATTNALVSGDTMTMSLLLDARAVLRNNAVPYVDGMYNVFLDNVSERQLFADPEFQLLYRGRGLQDPVYKNATIAEGLDMRFFKTTQAPQQLKSGTSGINIHRPIICGADVLVEGTFAGQEEAIAGLANDGLIEIIDDVVQVIRPPLDRFKQIAAQSWYWTGGYAVPTDATANRSVIPTASNAYLKRAVILETA
jgi:hypothetical protein